MPSLSPGRGSIHVDKPLTNISVAYMQNADGFVADRVFPIVPSQYQSDLYYELSRADWNRDQMKPRAPSTESQGGGYEWTRSNYFCEVYGFHRDIDDQLVANADSVIDLHGEATRFVTQISMIQREVNFASTYMTSGVWTYEVDGAASKSTTFVPTTANTANNNLVYWDSANATPIADISLLKRYVQLSTGFRPNTLVLARPVFDALLECPDIIDRLDRGQTPNGPAKASKAALTALFDLDDIMVMDGIVNTAAEDVAESNSFIAGNHALLLYRPRAAGRMTPSAGYTFTWTGYSGVGTFGTRVSKWYMQHIKAHRVEIESAYTQKIISADLAVFFKDIIS